MGSPMPAHRRQPSWSRGLADPRGVAEATSEGIPEGSDAEDDCQRIVVQLCNADSILAIGSVRCRDRTGHVPDPAFRDHEKPMDDAVTGCQSDFGTGCDEHSRPERYWLGQGALLVCGRWAIGRKQLFQVDSALSANAVEFCKIVHHEFSSDGRRIAEQTRFDH